LLYAFYDVTDVAAVAARSELAAAVERFLGVVPRTPWVDRNNPSVAL
jgi:hypothetical protein